MEIADMILQAAKDNDYTLAHYDRRSNIYIFRDRNLTNTVRLGFDDVDHMVQRIGKADTIAWLNKKFI